MKLPLPTWFIDRLIARAMRTPYIHLEGYLNRYWLRPYNRTGIAARIHQFVSSDVSRDLHNHPWPYVSVILRGGYWEETLCDDASRRLPGSDLVMHGKQLHQRKWYGPGSVLVRGADHFHRVLLDLDEGGLEQPCWTLFLTGPKRDDATDDSSCWGFMVDGAFVPANAYLGDRYVQTNYRGQA